MPPFIPSQSDRAYLVREINQLQANVQALQVQLQAITGGGVVFTLPTSDPGVAGYLWSNAGVVTVSAG